MSADRSLLDHICDLYLRKDGSFAEADREIERMRIAFEWASGQWVMLADKQTNALWGWMSWWRVSQELLDRIRDGDVEDEILNGHPQHLLTGPCAYISTAVVAPYAPTNTYRRLIDLTVEANNDAQLIAGHLQLKSGRTRWVERDYHEGKACLSVKANNQAAARL